MTHAHFESRFTTSTDGLRLHLRDYAPAGAAPLPVVCLPGLTRSAADFHVLATALSKETDGPPRRVVSIDYRGRGLSDRDPDWRHYDVRVEATDVIAQLAAQGIDRAAVIGTSRGGLIAMVLGALAPRLMAGVVLNDVGPVIDSKGLTRLRGTVGKLPVPGSWDDAVDLLKHLSSAHFPALSDDDWQTLARQSYLEIDGRLSALSDPAIGHTLASLDLEAPLPTLWPQFDGLQAVPMLVIRGEHSDLLSPETVAAMTARHPNCDVWLVPGQGHAPLLMDEPTITKIARFVARIPKP